MVGSRRSRQPPKVWEVKRKLTVWTSRSEGLGRLKSAYGRTYAYDGASRLTTFNGQTYGYGDAGPYHAVDRIGGQDRFDYDANGNVVKRNKGLDGEQALVWDAQNRLSQVRNKSGDLVEQYWYGVEGARVKKTSGGTTTYTFFAHYEEEVTGTVTTAVSHYSFGGLRFAVKRGAALHHLHGDHLGSTSLTTDTAGAATASRAYYAYGAERSSTGELQTDRTFTGQKRDATGLMYYNARYYDPALGTFVSPDSLVPDPGMVIDYNRFLYVRGNPLRYRDPSGHASCTTDACWERRWYEAHGYFMSGVSGHYSDERTAVFRDEGILRDVLKEAGIVVAASWNLSNPDEFRNVSLLAQGVVKLGQKITGVRGVGIEPAVAHLSSLGGGNVQWKRATDSMSGALGCVSSGATMVILACASGAEVEFYDVLFKRSTSTIEGTVIHEMAHVLHNRLCGLNVLFCASIAMNASILQVTYPITEYSAENYRDYFAESFTDFVMGSSGSGGYKVGEEWQDRFNSSLDRDRTPVHSLMADIIRGILVQ